MTVFLFVTASVALLGGVMALVQGCRHWLHRTGHRQGGRQWAHLRPGHPAIGISPVYCKPK